MVWKPTKRIIVLVLLIVTAIYTIAMIQSFLAYEEWRVQQLEPKNPVCIWAAVAGAIWISGEAALFASIGFVLLCKKGTTQRRLICC